MAQVIDIVRAALGHLRVVDDEDVPTPKQTEGAIAALNAMVQAWEGDGITLGWQPVTLPTQELIFPELQEMLGYNLAVRLRPRYGVTLDPDVKTLADMGMASLVAAVQSSSHDRVSYDDLPRGESQPNIYGWRAGFYL